MPPKPNALTAATRELAGERLAALVHALRDDATRLRAGALPGGRAALAARIAALPLDEGVERVVDDVDQRAAHLGARELGELALHESAVASGGASAARDERDEGPEGEK